jgi:hypothetical protein
MITPQISRRPAAVVSVLALGGLVALGRLHAQAPADPLTLDFQALQADGRPVTDLTAPQVSVRIDGKDRKVTAIKLVRAPGSDGAAKPAGEPPPPPFVSNASSDGSRSILFVIDEDSMRPGSERPVRDAIDQFLRGMSPIDRVGLVTAPRGVLRIDPTTAHTRVREALAQVTGHLSSTIADADRPCRARDMLTAITGLLNASGAGPSTMVVISAQMVAPAAQTARAGTSQPCDLTTNDFQKTGVAASQAHARVYVIQPDTSATANTEGLESLAGATGGQYQRISTDANPFARIALETSAYYVATVDSEAGDRNGQSHRVEIKVAREGTTVRTAPQMTLARPAARAAALSPKEIVKTTSAFRELPLRFAAYPSRGTDGKVQVLVIAEPLDRGTTLNAATLALIDGTGRIAVQASADEKQAATLPMLMAIPATPGSYRLRLAATDTNGRMGAVDHTFSADLVPAGPLKLSALVLGTTGANGFTPAFQFSTEPSAVAYLEIYGQIAGQQVTAQIEVAATVDGPAIASVKPGGRATAEPDKFILTAEIPLAALAPGDYVVRAIVALAGQPEGRVIQTLRKVQ